MQQQRFSHLDTSPVAVLYQRHAAKILLDVRKRVVSWEDAEGIVLDVFIAALEQEDKLIAIEDILQLAWLRRIARNKVIDFYRRSATRATLHLDDVEETMLAKDDEAPEQVALLHEDQVRLLEHLSELTGQQRVVLQLRFVADMRCQDIATLLNKQVSTVRSVLSHTLNFLRVAYFKQEGDA